MHLRVANWRTDFLHQCGTSHDRDHNAARNLLAAMHAAT